jgi:hypothetical protein
MLRTRACSFAATVLLAGCALAAPQPANVPGDDAAEIVETLLAIDPARHATPLAAMHGRAALYERWRDAARSGSATGWRVWLLLAQAALVHADAATSEAFQADLLPAFKAQPQPALQALADNGWLLPVACWHLGRHFDAEGRGGAGRADFLAAHEATLQRGLPAAAAAACLAQVRQPRRP